MTDEPGTVLLTPAHESALEEFVHLARAVADRTPHEPVIVSNRSEVLEQARTKIEGRCRYRMYTDTTDGDGREDQTEGSSAESPVTIERAKGWLWDLGRTAKERVPLFEFASVARQVWRLDQWSREARSLLAETDPRAVYVSGDRGLNPELALAKEAKNQGIPVVVTPWAFAGRDAPAHLRQDSERKRIDGDRERALKWFVAQRWEDQIYESRHGPMLFYNPAETVALALKGMLPDDPWVMGTGPSDWMALADRWDYERLTDLGLPESKAAITGQPSYDRLYENYQETRGGGTDDPLTFLVNLPPLAEHSLLPDEPAEKELVFLADALSDLDAKVVGSPHPKLSEKNRQLVRNRGVNVSEVPLPELIPSADLYLTVNSTTMRWAFSLGIPVVLFDFYDLGYEDFREIPGLDRITDHSRFRTVLHRLSEDRNEIDRLREAQAEASDYFQTVDGRALDRLLDLGGLAKVTDGSDSGPSSISAQGPTIFKEWIKQN